MLFTIGALFCGKYASVTESSRGDLSAEPVNTACHWMYRAFGLVIALPAVATGCDHSLHVLSGRAELPLRVRNITCAPDGMSPRQPIRPHRAALPASWTADSKMPLVPNWVPMRNSFPS